eukprot:6182406-Pleurochrysis_carterae.AAC.2
MQALAHRHRVHMVCGQRRAEHGLGVSARRRTLSHAGSRCEMSPSAADRCTRPGACSGSRGSW